MRSFFTLKISWKTSPGWLQLVFNFGTENRADQLKKPPCTFIYSSIWSELYCIPSRVEVGVRWCVDHIAMDFFLAIVCFFSHFHLYFCYLQFPITLSSASLNKQWWGEQFALLTMLLTFVIHEVLLVLYHFCVIGLTFMALLFSCYWHQLSL